jgi:hypothetical protein
MGRSRARTAVQGSRRSAHWRRRFPSGEQSSYVTSSFRHNFWILSAMCGTRILRIKIPHLLFSAPARNGRVG